jgi:hypothetical protein
MEFGMRWSTSEGSSYPDEPHIPILHPSLRQRDRQTFPIIFPCQFQKRRLSIPRPDPKIDRNLYGSRCGDVLPHYDVVVALEVHCKAGSQRV